MDRTVVQALSQLPERDRFVRGLRAWVGYAQIGVPYVRSDRVFGTSTNNIWKNFQWAIKGIFSFSFVPLQLITSISLLTFVVSVIGIVVQIVLRFLVPTPQGITTIIVLVLFLGSVQLLSLSIIGEYLAKIFEETKQRPPFLVRRIDRSDNWSSPVPSA
jgi:dolichol-phosphate mannosyltransferase